MATKKLTRVLLMQEAKSFAKQESKHDEPSLHGVTDGKAVGTYFEHKFNRHLNEKYDYEKGSSAKGIDFPELLIDMKVTSVKQPQSSCPFKEARQKIYGLGYSLLVFVYEKTDDSKKKTARLNIMHVVFVEAIKTADYQTTQGLIRILENNGNIDDVLGFFDDRNLPVDEIKAEELAKEIFENPPQLGYLTISNAMQWRLQYGRVIKEAGNVPGIEKVL